MLGLLIQGFLIGFAVAAPVGPIGVLCIKETLGRGWISGFVIGIGAALADTLYGAIAAFGLTFVTSFLHQHSEILRVIGGLFLMFIAYKAIWQAPITGIDKTEARSGRLFSSLVTTFFLTLTNPVTLVTFMAIFAGLGILSDVSNFEAGLAVFFVFLGSLTWWVFLSSGVHLAKSKMPENVIQRVNAISGMVIAAFGVVVLLSVIKGRWL